jgi:hypothetical protein
VVVGQLTEQSQRGRAGSGVLLLALAVEGGRAGA